MNLSGWLAFRTALAISLEIPFTSHEARLKREEREKVDEGLPDNKSNLKNEHEMFGNVQKLGAHARAHTEQIFLKSASGE